MTDDVDITQLLRRISDGEREAWDEALSRLYGVLKDKAHRLMQDQAGGHTLQTTALVHEAFLKLTGGEVDWESRRHFERVAIRAMRHVLVDHARGRNADKRGGPGREREFLADDIAQVGGPDFDVIALHEAIEKLALLDAETAEVAEMRCFGGLEHDDIGKLLDCSSRTVERRWRFARSWLKNAMAE